ncbi:uncharacterized protein LOC119262641 [Pygocentrus nattereri]|uniref:uncharacterized protein LOC119262641 n=1 Tax=Pygocentrus nattereri TaxID=42514 RepID=UPI001891B8E1|nr:uncharacterized protein LOC119262641 [Pygocentrus nattereri]
MATAGFFSCSECGMFSLDPFSTDSHNDSGVCSKCKLVNCLVEKVDKLELRIRGLIRDRQQGSLLAAPGTPGRASTPSTLALEPPQQGEWVTSRRHSRKAKANATAKATASPPVHHAPPVHVSNRFAPLSEAPAEEPVKGTLVIGDSIVRHVKLATPLGAPAARVICLPGARAPDISGNLRLLANRRYSRVVIHVGANDIRLRQSEVTKANIKEVVKQAQTLSEEVICSGPIPMRRGDEAYSRLSSLNRWMSKWCTDNHVGFIDNWLMFEGKPGLLGRDGVHPTRDGAALLSCSIEERLPVRYTAEEIKKFLSVTKGYRGVQCLGEATGDQEHITARKRKKAALTDLLGMTTHFRNVTELDAPLKFFGLELKNGQKRFMHAVRSESGDLVSKPSEIRQQTVNFFSKLFESEWASCRDVEERFFPLQARITQQSATLLDAELSLGELHEALQGMENGWAPEIDGLPVEFYKAFWSVLGQDVLEVLRVSVQEGKLPLSFRKAVLTLLPKKRRPDGAEELAPCGIAVHRLQAALKSVSLQTGEGDGAGGAS